MIMSARAKISAADTNSAPVAMIIMVAQPGTQPRPGLDQH